VSRVQRLRHISSSNFGVINMWSYTSSPPHILVDNFTQSFVELITVSIIPAIGTYSEQRYSVHILKSYVSEIHFNIVLPFEHRFPKLCLPFRYYNYNFVLRSNFPSLVLHVQPISFFTFVIKHANNIL
jgi:hypothetical protein